MTDGQWLNAGATWLWLVALHSFLMGLVFFAWTRVEALAPGRSRRWLLAMILVLPPVTSSLALLRRMLEPATAWFDSQRLLNLDVFAGFEMTQVALAIGGVTLMMTVLQEIVPVLFPPVRSEHPAPETLVEVARSQQGWHGIEVVMIDDSLAAATGGTPWRPKIFLSVNLAESFDEDEIRAVVRHEHAHMSPRRWWTVHLLFVVRMLQAHNPVAMWVSREYAVETEIECDRLAAGDDPRVLARVLFAIWGEVGSRDWVRRRVLQRRIDVLLGRSPESHRVARLPSTSLLISGFVMALLLPWII